MYAVEANSVKGVEKLKSYSLIPPSETYEAGYKVDVPIADLSAFK